VYKAAHTWQLGKAEGATPSMVSSKLHPGGYSQRELLKVIAVSCHRTIESWNHRMA